MCLPPVKDDGHRPSVKRPLTWAGGRALPRDVGKGRLNWFNLLHGRRAINVTSATPYDFKSESQACIFTFQRRDSFMQIVDCLPRFWRNQINRFKRLPDFSHGLRAA